MLPKKGDEAYLWDMLDAARAVGEFVSGKSFSDYASDRMLRGAVERHIEIVGEAARRVSVQLQAEHPEIPWTGIIGQRNVLAHDYGDIKHERIWRVATEMLPVLVGQLSPLIPDPPPEY